MMWAVGRPAGRSTRVVLDELVQRLGRWGRGLQQPHEVVAQHHHPADFGDAGAVAAHAAARAVHEVLEQRVADEVGGDEVAAARLADVHRVEARGHAVGAVERRRADRKSVV